MIRYATITCLIMIGTGCGGGGDTQDGAIDAPPSAACLEANTYQNLTNIEEKVFKTSCIFSGCHNGQATDAGRLDLRTGNSHGFLVNFDSGIAPGRKLVVPGDPAASYLLVMLGEIEPGDANPPVAPPPASVGLMPQNTGGQLLCGEKRRAVQRWIEAGALDN